MPTLTDLQVDFVSLVDRAAVRDPVNQAEPMRFLVTKAEHAFVVWKRDGSHLPAAPQPQPRDWVPAFVAHLERRGRELEAAVAKAERAVEAAQTATSSIPDHHQKEPNMPTMTAVQKVEQAADRIRKADPSKSRQQAFVQAIQTDRELAAEYLAEQRAAACTPLPNQDIASPIGKAMAEKVAKGETVDPEMQQRYAAAMRGQAA